MVQIRIREAEACAPQPNLLWDTIWRQELDATGGFGDWLLAGPDDQPESRGGLRAEAALHTATLLCLFTNARVEADEPLVGADGDLGGWWGDSIRLSGEPQQSLGSRLWLLERAVLNERTRLLAKTYAEEALAVLAEQGAVARTEVEAEIDRQRGLLALAVRHYSHDGRKAYDQRFDVVWRQSAANAPMNF